MTEEEELWNAHEWPAMLSALALHQRTNQPRYRRLRLFACACCRQVWDDRWPVPSREVVSVSERFADGVASPEELRAASALAEGASRQYSESLNAVSPDVYSVIEERLHLAWCTAVEDEGLSGLLTSGISCALSARLFCMDDELQQVIPALLRCIFGNPFRPVAFDPRWRTETVVALAAGIYDGRHYDRLPILADALEEAGCDAAELLSHLRGPGPHARGCWAVDAVLGRA